MSYILRRRVRNAIYVYECTSYRNKHGKPRTKQKYLGKLDHDGILITKKRKLPAQIREVKTITRRFILEAIPKTQNLPAGLRQNFTSKKTTPIPKASSSTISPVAAILSPYATNSSSHLLTEHIPFFRYFKPMMRN